MKLILSTQENDVLLKAIKHGGKALKITNRFLNGKLCTEGNEQEFLLLHEICQDYLLFEGFDENYDVTSTGRILERVIDKIFNVLEKS